MDRCRLAEFLLMSEITRSRGCRSPVRRRVGFVRFHLCPPNRTGVSRWALAESQDGKPFLRRSVAVADRFRDLPGEVLFAEYLRFGNMKRSQHFSGIARRSDAVDEHRVRLFSRLSRS